MLGNVQKQPADTLDYDVDFGKWLPDDDEILTVVATATTIDGEATPLVIDSVQVASPIVKVWLSGGTDGSGYVVTVTIATAGGRIKETEFKLRVKDY